MKKYFLILILLSMIATANDGLKETLQKYQIQPVEMKYELEVYWSVRERTNKRDGTALFTAEDKFRVTLGKYLWICNSDTVWQYSKRRGQVTIYSPERAPFEMPNRLFKFLLDTPFKTEKLQHLDRWVARWENSDSTFNGTYTEALIEYNSKRQEVTSIFLKDYEGNTFTYSIQETTFYKSVAENSFSFKIPEGVEIIEKM